MRGVCTFPQKKPELKQGRERDGGPAPCLMSGFATAAGGGGAIRSTSAGPAVGRTAFMLRFAAFAPSFMPVPAFFFPAAGKFIAVAACGGPVVVIAAEGTAS